MSRYLRTRWLRTQEAPGASQDLLPIRADDRPQSATATSNTNVLTVQLRPHVRCGIDHEIRFVDRQDLNFEFGVTLALADCGGDFAA